MADPYFNNVVLLLQGHGDNGSQVFTDYSNSNHSISVYGNTKMSNVQQLFGQNTIEFDANGDTLKLDWSSDWQLSVGQSFTIECWFYAKSTNTRQFYILNHVDTNITPRDYGFFFAVNGNSGVTPYRKLAFTVYQLEVDPWTRNTITSDADVTKDVWHHAAISYDGTNYYLGLDGVVKSQARTVPSFATTSRPLYVGADDENDVNWTGLLGFMQDLRITKGIARYTNNYTPPIDLFPTESTYEGPTLPSSLKAVPIKQNYSHFYRHL